MGWNARAELKTRCIVQEISWTQSDALVGVIEGHQSAAERAARPGREEKFMSKKVHGYCLCRMSATCRWSTATARRRPCAADGDGALAGRASPVQLPRGRAQTYAQLLALWPSNAGRHCFRTARHRSTRCGHDDASISGKHRAGRAPQRKPDAYRNYKALGTQDCGLKEQVSARQAGRCDRGPARIGEVGSERSRPSG